MANSVIVANKIKPYNKIIEIEGDKSLSIRWALLASQAIGKSKAINILRSDDVINSLKCLRQLGIKVRLKKKFCEIKSNGLNSFIYKKKLLLMRETRVLWVD